MKVEVFFMDVFVAIVVLAILIEKIGAVVKTGMSPLKLPGPAWFGITAALGVALCILFQIDLFVAIGLTSLTPASYIVGQVITGIAVGSGSGFVHDLIDNLNAGKAASKSITNKTDTKV